MGITLADQLETLKVKQFQDLCTQEHKAFSSGDLTAGFTGAHDNVVGTAADIGQRVTAKDFSTPGVN